MSDQYFHGCPYCDFRCKGGSSSNWHVKSKHPEKPLPSDKDFPGWKE